MDAVFSWFRATDENIAITFIVFLSNRGIPRPPASPRSSCTAALHYNDFRVLCLMAREQVAFPPPPPPLWQQQQKLMPGCQKMGIGWQSLLLPLLKMRNLVLARCTALEIRRAGAMKKGGWSLLALVLVLLLLLLCTAIMSV